jgi:hypothetical protein
VFFTVLAMASMASWDSVVHMVQRVLRLHMGEEVCDVGVELALMLVLLRPPGI